MDNFRRPRPARVYSQQLEWLRIEQKLEHAVVVAQHLSFGQIFVTGNAGLVRDLALRQLFFGWANHGNFRDGVNPIREAVRGFIESFSEHVATGQTSLLHASAAHATESYYISASLHMVHGRLVT